MKRNNLEKNSVRDYHNRTFSLLGGIAIALALLVARGGAIEITFNNQPTTGGSPPNQWARYANVATVNGTDIHPR